MNCFKTLRPALPTLHLTDVTTFKLATVKTGYEVKKQRFNYRRCSNLGFFKIALVVLDNQRFTMFHH